MIFLILCFGHKMYCLLIEVAKVQITCTYRVVQIGPLEKKNW